MPPSSLIGAIMGAQPINLRRNALAICREFGKAAVTLLRRGGLCSLPLEGRGRGWGLLPRTQCQLNNPHPAAATLPSRGRGAMRHGLPSPLAGEGGAIAPDEGEP